MKNRLWASFLLILLLWGCSTGNPVQEKIEDAADQAKKEQSEPMPVGQIGGSETAPLPKAEETEIEKDASPLQSSDDLEELTVHYINAGQADAALLSFSENGEQFRILIDAGNWNSTDVVSYLREQHVEHLDIIAGTHPHADHIGQIDKIIEQIETDEVWLSGDTANSKVFSRVLDAIELNDTGYYEPRAGDVFDVGPMVIEIFNPNEINGDVHEGSLSMKLTYGDVSFLFTGDAEVQTEQKMIDSGYDLKADFLQLGHHGSKTSTSLPFLEAVDPKVAIISAGEDSQYDHPHEEVVSRVKAKGIDIYETSVHGSIVVVTDGSTYTVGTVKDDSTRDEPAGTPEEKPVEKPAENQAAPSADCIDVNSASYEELMNITHIGPARAKDLIELRPFASVEDLSRIKGIGPGRIADILAEGAACTGG
ncbi:MBL fold metallo-hydrolase [Sporosarcina cascadiensis]|uniref:MBL fold metallo-hydrolase n=1 Tax=Sporosarcina cascadiensis TaxID=2660747 RepID=UPI001E38B3D8|nr:MBL fold metallo-hydrolase [Sporosarcina cascadiensis]